MDQTEKNKKASAAVEAINKDLGPRSVFTLTDKPIKHPAISTGSIRLDLALGIGGFPKGRIIEIYGPESSGKTTIATHVIAEAQRLGGTCAFIDAEHAFDELYAQALGVDISALKISQPDNGEQALEIADRLISSGGFDVVVIDSVAALTPKKELEGEMGASVMGLQARLMSQALRKMVATVAKTNTVLIFINQLREKIGVMFGNPETTTGGNALKFYASVRLDVRRVSTNKDGEEAVSNRTKVKVMKNKVASPFKVVEFNIVFGKGIDKFAEIIELGVELDLIQKSGSWYSYKNEKIGQGFASVCQFFSDNEGFAREIEERIKTIINENQL